MGKTRKARPRKQVPDDYFAAGPIEIARFGKNVIARSRATAEQFAAIQAGLAARHPKVVEEIDALVARVAERVARLPGDELLKRAWWDFAIAMTVASEKVDETEQAQARRMIDYVQSVIASVPPSPIVEEEISEEEWAGLRSDVAKLFKQLTHEYQISRAAHRRAADAAVDIELEEFQFRAEVLWMNVRGQRYHAHERQALLDVLAPHSDVLVRLFGVDAQTIVGELDKILMKLTRGLADAVEEFDRFREDTLAAMGALAKEAESASIDELRDKVFEDEARAARGRQVMGELFGMDMFDVEHVTDLPKSLVDELTWSPGEDTDFFAEGPYRGWPLRAWPIFKRPFIRLNGRTYCFDISGLFDNIYEFFSGLYLSLLLTIRKGGTSGRKPFPSNCRLST
jgi:preprotein translocase subunit SecA